MYSDFEFMALMVKAGHGNYIGKGKKGNDIWNRFRGFEFIIYPEHFKDIDDIIKKCNDLKIPCCLSPLHDKDLKEDGSLKKAHYHFIMYYDGKTTIYRAYSDFINTFGEDAFVTVEVVGNMVGAVEYQAHIDNDDKARYDSNDILGFNGFNVSKYLVKGLSDDIMSIKKELKAIIKENDIIFFNQLDDYLEDNNIVLAECVSRNREIQHWCKDYLISKEHEMWYKGEIEKSKTITVYRGGKPEISKKEIFNREIKAV